MAEKIRNEDLQLNIIVNGDVGRKRILELEQTSCCCWCKVKNSESKSQH